MAEAPGLPAAQVGAPSGPAAAAVVSPRAYAMLALATVGFGLCFWAWALVSPLRPRYRDDLGLSAFQQSFLITVPVVVGSLGRIPVGALTDRLGARVMFPGRRRHDRAGAVRRLRGLVRAAGPRRLLPRPGRHRLRRGRAVRERLVPPARRGFALGVSGIGMGGTAISAFTTVKLVDAHGRTFPFLLVAVVLAAYGLLVLRTRRGAR